MKTAAWIRGLIDEGVQPLPVSVNVSRADIYLVDVAAELHALVERYGIEPSLIEVEITESAYSERPGIASWPRSTSWPSAASPCSWTTSAAATRRSTC